MNDPTEIARLSADQRRDNRMCTAGISRERIGRTWVEHTDALDVDELERLIVEDVSSVTPSDAERLKAAIDRLPEQQREVVNLLFWERVTEREAAERLNVSRRAVQIHRDRALARLREVLGGALPFEAAS